MITDGTPNITSANICGNDLLWRGKDGTYTAPYNCSIWYAAQADSNNISLFIIGVGPGVNKDLLTAMATGTDPNPVPGDDGFYFAGQGQFFPVVQPTELNGAIEAILTQARSCQISAQISSVSGYSVASTHPLLVRLENHAPAAGPYDIYLNNNARGEYRICANVPTDALSRTAPDPACDLSPIPAGLYDLYSTTAGTTMPRLAPAPVQVEIVPTIIISGGNTWAAHSDISINLVAHQVSQEPYNIYFDYGGAYSQTIAPNVAANPGPIAWKVPDVGTLCPIGGSPCTIESRGANDPSLTYASTTLYITQPKILLLGGSGPYAGGESVLISLKDHTPGLPYDLKMSGITQTLYLGRILPTNSLGDTNTPLLWTIPLTWPNGIYDLTSHPAVDPPDLDSANQIAILEDVEFNTAFDLRIYLPTILK